MLPKFSRMPIATQALIILVMMLASTSSALYFLASNNAIEGELSQTRTVADMAESFRSLAAKHGGFYVRHVSTDDPQNVGRYLASYEMADPKASVPTSHVFYQKNPFLALTDYSNEVAVSTTKAKFRIVSDNYMNPANAPDIFEMMALRAMRDRSKNGDNNEFWAVDKGQLRYARGMTATAACLGCHGKASDAPEAVRTQYRAPVGTTVGGGYGYQEGQMVGLTSVTVPHQSPLQMIASQKMGFWISSGLVVGLMLLSFCLVYLGIVKPLRAQYDYSHSLATSHTPETVKAPISTADDHSSRNEIHRQTSALKALHESMITAMKFVSRARK
jgi:Protein of unknown function (DUF3365)